jgi:hypothetical protein
MINFCGGEKSFPHISVSEMLGRNFNKSTLKDRIVFVGLTDKRNSDQQRTPYTSKLSSTELWATITANTLSSPPFIRFHLIILSLIIPVLVIIGVGFLTEFVISMPYKKGTTITLVGAGALVVVSFVIFAAGYWISLLLPILYLAGLAIWLTYRRIKYGIPQTIKLDDIEYDTNGSLKRIGRYVIEKEIGSGSMGTVYKAIDPKINRVVAVKIIKLGGALDSQKELRERFAREARAAGGLAHPSIVTVHDFGETKALAYMVMEFIEGESLEEKLAKLKKIAPAETVRIINCVADGLQKAHEQGIIHRDIKPSNIMTMKDTNEVKLMDFGVAKITGNLTDTGKTLGTPFYMSPEQLNGEEIDSRTDVFALAVTAYECLSGVRPFAGDNLSALTYSILHKNPASISEKNPDIPASADSVFAKALAKERDNRYPDATAFAKALTTALSK